MGRLIKDTTTKPVLSGLEFFRVQDVDGRSYDASIAQIMNDTAPAEFTLASGNGTTANGSAVDLGGLMNSHIIIDNQGSYNFRIQNGFNDSHYWFNDDSMHIQYEAFGGNNFGNLSLDYNDCVINLADYTNDTYSYSKFEATTSYGRNQVSVQNSVGTMKIDMDTRNGIKFTDGIGLGIHMADLKAGIDQATAGAIANEIWVDTSAGQVLKRGV